MTVIKRSSRHVSSQSLNFQLNLFQICSSCSSFRRTFNFIFKAIFRYHCSMKLWIITHFIGRGSYRRSFILAFIQYSAQTSVFFLLQCFSEQKSSFEQLSRNFFSIILHVIGVYTSTELEWNACLSNETYFRVLYYNADKRRLLFLLTNRNICEALQKKHIFSYCH